MQDNPANWIIWQTFMKDNPSNRQDRYRIAVHVPQIKYVTPVREHYLSKMSVKRHATYSQTVNTEVIKLKPEFVFSVII